VRIEGGNDEFLGNCRETGRSGRSATGARRLFMARAMAMRMLSSSCGSADSVVTINVAMKRFGRRIGRILSVTAVVFTWTAGPWVPAAVCAFESIAQESVAASKPDCGKCTHAGEQEAPERDCCKRVLDSCCLSAPGTSGTPSAGAQVEAPALAATVPVMLTPSFTGRAPAAWSFVDPVPRVPLSTSVLRL